MVVKNGGHLKSNLMSIAQNNLAGLVTKKFHNSQPMKSILRTHISKFQDLEARIQYVMVKKNIFYIKILEI